MTALERLRRLAKLLTSPPTLDAHRMDAFRREFTDATSPEAILALIADVERLIAAGNDTRSVCADGVTHSVWENRGRAAVQAWDEAVAALRAKGEA